MKILFNINDYKSVIKAKIVEHSKVRGYRSKLAEVAGCQLAYLSLVLKSHAHLTPDQGAALTVFWQLDELHTDYFMNLLHLARAGTPVLQKQLRSKLETLRKTFRESRNQYDHPEISDTERALKYYSIWIYSAIHLLLTIPDYQDARKLAEQLSLPLKEVEGYLKELERLSLVRQQNNKWISTEQNLHAGPAFTNLHHRNWRSKALNEIDVKPDLHLHYTGVFSLSHDDFLALRAHVQEFIERVHQKVAPSKEEAGAVLILDWLKF